MTQIPALLLPKGTHGQKASVKKSPEFYVREQKPIKIAALLKGTHGHKENISQNGRKQRRRKGSM